MWKALKPVLGSPLKESPAGKARALSAGDPPEAPHDPLTAPLSSYIQARVQDLSNRLKGDAQEGELPLQPGRLLPTLKAKMGWYKVAKSDFDFNEAEWDPALKEIGRVGE